MNKVLETAVIFGKKYGLTILGLSLSLAQAVITGKQDEDRIAAAVEDYMKKHCTEVKSN